MMITTAPPPSSATAANAARPVKQPAANGTGMPFNAILSQEVAQRGAESSAVDADTVAQGAKDKATPRVAATGEKSKSEDQDASSGGIAPELLALVADIGQLTGNTPTDPAKVPVAEDAALHTDARTSKPIAFSLGKAEFNEKATASFQRASAPAAESLGAVNDTARPDVSGFADTIKRFSPDGAGISRVDVAGLDGASMQTDASANTLFPLQQAAGTFAAPAVVPASDRLMPPVGTPSWDQALGNKIVWMAGNDLQTASLSLNPPDLGPLQVVLNVSNNQASATFSSDQPEVRQALEAAMPKLREMMEDAGIQLGQASVDSGSPSRHESAERGTHSGPRSADGRDAFTVAGADASSIRVQPTSRGQGLVDTFA